MAGHRTIVGGVVAAAAWAALAGPAAKANTVVNERVVLDGCEVGGGGNDIHSVQSHQGPCDCWARHTAVGAHQRHRPPRDAAGTGDYLGAQVGFLVRKGCDGCGGGGAG